MARRGMQVSRECSLFRDATSRAVAPSTSIVAIVALVSAFCAPPLRSVRASEFLGLWARAAKTLVVITEADGTLVVTQFDRDNAL